MSLKTNRFQLIATQQCVAIFLCKYFCKEQKIHCFQRKWNYHYDIT
jgi:hypothetical protein